MFLITRGQVYWSLQSRKQRFTEDMLLTLANPSPEFILNWLEMPSQTLSNLILTYFFMKAESH